MKEILLNDYSIIGANAQKAIEKGLAEADWYTTPIARDSMRELLERKNGPAIRDTFIWFFLLGMSGYSGYLLWGTWWAIIPFSIYGVLYASCSDSRWHESSHGTAFKTDWLNDFLYELASFMVMRESTSWRWSHTRHHSDTIIVGRDPEIAVPRPPDILGILLNFFNLGVYPAYWKRLISHCLGIITAEEKTYVPESEFKKIFFKARIHLLVYLIVIGLSIYYKSILPIMYIGLVNIYGSWLMVIYGLTQHAGLAENVLDHRLNCRTVYMNPIHRYLYWNMNYHVEHHMFPLVPYHALPRLHELVKEDFPKPYNGLIETYKEIIPTIFKQVKDPGFYIKRSLPEKKEQSVVSNQTKINLSSIGNDWVEIPEGNKLRKADVMRFDYNKKTFAIYRTKDDKYYASDGICTHGNTHLADGLVIGNQIECPKHNGRFDITDGTPKRAPVCINLQTYPIKIENEKIFINVNSNSPKEKVYQFKVKSNENVATFIKELVLEPFDEEASISFKPGDYMQFNIPEYKEIKFSDLNVKEPYSNVWKAQHVVDYKAVNTQSGRRNYSLANNPTLEKKLRFNIRIATPPRGQDCNAGVGSTYMHNLKEGDIISAIGPFGDFHIKESTKEMVYIGGGAGMAPLRSHISYLLETIKSGRKISYWYGARSRQELFYEDYFRSLEQKFTNFSFHVAMSEPQPSCEWHSHVGYIHEIVMKEHLNNHPSPKEIEYYLCGPPAMIEATKATLNGMGVGKEQISFDEF